MLVVKNSSASAGDIRKRYEFNPRVGKIPRGVFIVMWAFSLLAVGGASSPAAVCGLLTAVASLAEHGL